jgi:hypothetical protein
MVIIGPRAREADAAVIHDDRVDFAVEPEFDMHMPRRVNGKREPFWAGIDVRITWEMVVLRFYRSPFRASLNAIHFVRSFVVIAFASRDEEASSSWPIFNTNHRLTGPHVADCKGSR